MIEEWGLSVPKGRTSMSGGALSMDYCLFVFYANHSIYLNTVLSFFLPGMSDSINVMFPRLY